MRMKKFCSVALVLVLALSLVLSGCGKKNTNVIKIGVFEPASGDNGAGGKQEVLGIRYANSLVPTVEIDGQTYEIQLVEVDNQSNTTTAVTAAQKLVSDKVSVVLGSYGSGVSIAAGEIFSEAGIPAIGCSCTNPQVTEGNPYYFRVCYIDPFQGTVMANFASDEIGAKKAYVLTQLGDDYSAGLGNYFAEAFEALGGEVVTADFPEGTSDFTAYLTAAKNEGADVMFCPTSTTVASYIITQAVSEGVTFPLMAGDTWENSAIINAAVGTDIEVYLSTFFDENDTSSTVASEFVEGFKEYLNSDAQNLTNNGDNDIVAAVSALGYDAYMVAIEAIKAAGSADPEAIKEALSGVSYEGVTGSVTFDENGDAQKDMAYIKTVDTAGEGAFSFIKTQSVADID
jgi:branched-chain amino acid transport system substrate-binding protein